MDSSKTKHPLPEGDGALALPSVGAPVVAAEPSVYTDACTVKGCPRPNDPDWHVPWCQEIRGHQCFGGATHCHWPKKGMGGGRKSKIVACLCQGMHDAVDNGVKYGNAVIIDENGKEAYRLWEVTKDPPGKTLIQRVIGEGGRRHASGAEESATARGIPDSTPTPRSDHPPRVIGEGGRSATGMARGSPTARLPNAGSSPRSKTSVPAPLSDHPPQVIGEGRQDDACEPDVARSARVVGESPAPLSDQLPQEAHETAQDEAVTTYARVPVVYVTPPRALPEFPDYQYEEGHLILRENLPPERFQEIVAKLFYMRRNIDWLIGDAIVYAERTYGEEAYQYLPDFTEAGFGLEQIKQCAWVASKVDPSTRVPSLSFTHHRAVAALPEPEQTEWLKRAAAEGMSSRALHECVATKREPEPCVHEWKCTKCGKERN